MTALLPQQMETPFPQGSQTRFEEGVKAFGKITLTAISGAALVIAVVGALGFFGSLVTMSIALPLTIKAAFILIGTSAAISSLLLKNQFYPSEEIQEEDYNQNVNQNLAALTAEVHAALAEIRSPQRNEEGGSPDQ